MHKTNHEYLRKVYDRYGTRRLTPTLFTTELLKSRMTPGEYSYDPSSFRLTNNYLTLANDDVVMPGDFVEDLDTGQREEVVKGRFYGALAYSRVSEAKKLPAVVGIVRKVVT